MLTIDALKEFGANTDEGMKRCFGKEEFYLRLVKTVPNEPAFEQLSTAIDEGDLKKAFEHAHALKGVLANLSLSPLSEPMSEMTEHLRAGEQMDYKPFLDTIISKRDELKAMCEE